MAIVEQFLLRLAGGICILGLPPLILLSGLYLFMSPAYIQHAYRQPGFPPLTRLTVQQRDTAALECIRYLRTGAGIEILQRLQGDEGPLFSERELRHMVDVKVVSRGAFAAHSLCAALVLVAASYLFRFGPRGEVLRRLAQGAGLTAGLLALVLLSAVADFDRFFTLFHRVFFEGETWLFLFTDTLIQCFPLVFWFDIVKWWMIGALAASGLVGGLAWWGLRRMTA